VFFVEKIVVLDRSMGSAASQAARKQTSPPGSYTLARQAASKEASQWIMEDGRPCQDVGSSSPRQFPVTWDAGETGTHPFLGTYREYIFAGLVCLALY